jgi:hypothetical protein
MRERHPAFFRQRPDILRKDFMRFAYLCHLAETLTPAARRTRRDTDYGRFFTRDATITSKLACHRTSERLRASTMNRSLPRISYALPFVAAILAACSSAAVPDDADTSTQHAPDTATTQDAPDMVSVELAEAPRAEVISIGGEMAPVNLLAKVYPDGSAKPATSTPAGRTPFEIPRRLEVLVGNAGNGEARLTVGNAKGTEFTCTYRGGASSSEPVDALDLARGKFYDLESCSNGLTAGARAVGTLFSLQLLSGAPKIGRTSVQLDLGDGCQTSIGYPMDPVESVLLREAFDWKESKALPDFNAAGNPNLYYVSIYVEGSGQWKALDDLRVNYRNKPYFERELEQFDGKCGAVNHSGDGNGAFVYAVLPAQIYNAIRDIEQDDGAARNPEYPGFRAITMRDVPKDFRGEDGALSYEALAEAGFKYDPNYDPSAEPRVKVRGIFGDAWRWAVDTVDDVVDGVEKAFSEVDKLISGEVQVALRTHVFTTDDAFVGDEEKTSLRRVWGPMTGHEMYLEGVRVDFGIARAGIIPEVVEGKLGTTGSVMVKVADGTDSSSICLVFDTDAARFENYYAGIHEVCNFGNGSGDGPAGSRHFDKNTDLDWDVEYWEASLMAQFVDADKYARDVLGVRPDEKARVLLEGVANWQENVFTPCFNMSDFDVAEIFPVLEIFASVDMILPSDLPRVRSKRTVIPHEYGHYLMCMMVDNSSTVGVEKLINSRFWEGGDVDPGDFTAIFMESFADFISQQLSGGVEYFNPDDPTRIFEETITDEWGSSYCHLPVKPATFPPLYFGPHCLDRNFDGTEPGLDPRGEAYRMIGMYASLWHDIFDGHPGAYDDNVPVNANIYVLNDDGPVDFLRIAQWPFGPGGRPLEYIDDDSITLSGPNMFDWISHWQNPTSGHSGRFTRNDILGAVDWIMLGEGYDWCRRCAVVAMHDSSATSPWDSGSMFSYCPFQDWLAGTPPVADVRRLTVKCEVCPVGHSPNAFGECFPDIIVNPPPCEPHEHLFDNLCYTCPPDTMFLEGVCYHCQPGQLVDDGSKNGPGGCVDECGPGKTEAPEGICSMIPL